jgi:hypothetical protein
LKVWIVSVPSVVTVPDVEDEEAVNLLITTTPSPPLIFEEG